MEWSDEGIVLGVRRHGETSAIVELLTRERGRHLGLVRGGVGSRMRPVLQPGNSVRAVWRARLDEHLGFYVVEGLRLRAGTLLGLRHGAYGLTHLAGLVRLLPERDPHADLFATLHALLDDFDEAKRAAIAMVRFELAMIAELGFGLDLSRCAATGVRENLVYVSPKSGGAVSREAGMPWHDRLLPLPAFLRRGAAMDASAESARLQSAYLESGIRESEVRGSEVRESEIRESDIADGFRLTGYFLTHHVLAPRGLTHSDARQGFINAILREERAASVAAMSDLAVSSGAAI